MPKFKLVIRPSDKQQDDKLPVFLRFTHRRFVIYKQTGVYVFEDQWNPVTQTVKRNHPLSNTYNKHIRRFVTKAETRWIESKDAEPSTAKDIREILFSEEKPEVK